MAYSVFLDANILMELVLGRVRSEAVREVVRALPDDNDLAISILSVNTLFYYIEKFGLQKARVHEFIKNYRILNIDESDYVWARDNDAGDFEDALQVACARRHGCTKVITLDKKMDKQYGKYIVIETVV